MNEHRGMYWITQMELARWSKANLMGLNETRLSDGSGDSLTISIGEDFDGGPYLIVDGHWSGLVINQVQLITLKPGGIDTHTHPYPDQAAMMLAFDAHAKALGKEPRILLHNSYATETAERWGILAKHHYTQALAQAQVGNGLCIDQATHTSLYKKARS